MEHLVEPFSSRCHANVFLCCGNRGSTSRCLAMGAAVKQPSLIRYIGIASRWLVMDAACHNAPSLRLFVPNSLTVYHRSLLSEVPARDVIFLGCSGFYFFSYGVHSPTNITAPSLRGLVPSDTR
jgi:hypothetical protein